MTIGNNAEGCDSMAFAFGTVYVMNEHGRTVATYRLPPYSSWEARRGIPASRDDLPTDQKAA